MIPTFAIVGRVNEGKSSIVAALTESEDIAIGPEPGTTRKTHAYDVGDDDGVLFRMYDTPGFQEPEAVHAWLQGKAATAAERPEAVRAFLRAHAAGDAFADERELLTPIMEEDASVLYVVDGSHPFRANYELEMQILQWTGRPRFALINTIGQGRHIGEWEAALGQYFSVVRLFDAQKVGLADRLSLLSMLAEMDERCRPELTLAIQRLKAQRTRRIAAAAAAVAAALADMVTFQVSEPLSRSEITSDDRSRLERRYQRGITTREAEARRAVERIFNYLRLDRVEAPVSPPLYERDLFSRETFRLLGLTKSQLMVTATAVGGLAGLAVDAATGGHSLGLGALAGAALFGIAGAAAATREPEVDLLGLRFSGRDTTVGPTRHPQFAWVLLDRALLHARAVMHRSHAVRGAVELTDSGERQGIAGTLGTREQARFEAVFAKLRRGRNREKGAETLTPLLQDLLARLDAAEPGV